MYMQIIKIILGGLMVSVSFSPVMSIVQRQMGLFNDETIQTMLNFQTKQVFSIMGGNFAPKLSASLPTIPIQSQIFFSNANGIGIPSLKKCMLFNSEMIQTEFLCKKKFRFFDEFLVLGFPDPFIEISFDIQLHNEYDLDKENNLIKEEKKKDRSIFLNQKCDCSLKHKKVLANIQNLQINIYDFILNDKYIDTKELNQDLNKITTNMVNPSEKIKQEKPDQHPKGDFELKKISTKDAEEKIFSMQKIGTIKPNNDQQFKNDDIDLLINKISKKVQLPSDLFRRENTGISVFKKNVSDDESSQIEPNLIDYQLGQKSKGRYNNFEKKVILESMKTENILQFEINLTGKKQDITELFNYTMDGSNFNNLNCQWNDTDIQKEIQEIYTNRDKSRIKLKEQSKKLTSDVENKLIDILSKVLEVLFNHKKCYQVISTNDQMAQEYKSAQNHYKNINNRAFMNI